MDEAVAIVTDLFFQVRISAAAKAAGRRVRFVSSPEALDPSGYFALALVDLDAQTDVLRSIRLLSENPQMTVIAFGPHLDTDKRKAARKAGATRVLAKSKFVEELPRLMRLDAPNSEGTPSGTDS